MKERLEAIIKHENITPSKLADLIGVQRSGVSHIMSGRNKPGLDFLNKLLQQFPHINGDWLITGNGPMLKGKPTKGTVEQMSIPATNEAKLTPVSSSRASSEENAPVYQKLAQKTQKSSVTELISDTKDIERIVIFYKDKSFSDYKPE